MKKTQCKFKIKTKSSLSVEKPIVIELDVNLGEFDLGKKTFTLYPLNDINDAVFHRLCCLAIAGIPADGYLINGNEFQHFEDIKLENLNWGNMSLLDDEITIDAIFSYEDQTSGSLR